MDNTELKYYAGTKDGKDWGFYLEPDGLLDGWTELTEEEHDALIKANQEQGKDIKFQKNKKPISVDYIPSREETLRAELRELESYLKETDYIASKIAEGVATKDEYKEQLTKRQQSRDRINQIRAELDIQPTH